MATSKITWTGPKAVLDAAAALLTELLWPPAAAVSLVKDDDGAEDADAGWRLEAYFDGAPDIDALAAALKETGLGRGVLEKVPDIDWVAHALSGLGIVRAGRFVLYGAHDADKLPDEDGAIAIRIDANEAFGTGHHPTTAGCLTLLDRFAGMAPRAILDLGTGSAVLAIAAAKLWDKNVLAVDIDAKSVEIARANAALNAIADKVTIAVADGFASTVVARAAPFDFVFANILAGPLIDFAPPMAAHMRPSGRAMLAGLMSEQEASVSAAYEAAGFRRLNRLDHQTWPVLLFVRV
ncbi:MAG: 50S ribosomal protein L11 methyltransferase [Parvularculaceae bacterium]